jgi:photosystem II stability/assembly factor-like uncharacterized protein
MTEHAQPPRRAVRGAHAAALACILGGLLDAHAARANGRYPASNQIVFAPSDPNVVVVRGTFAILISHDHGSTWRALCEDALGLPSNVVEDPTLALTSSAFLAALASPAPGLDVSNDLGCNWSCIGGPLAGQGVVDLAVRPNAPSAAVALTLNYVQSDAGVAQLSQVFESQDDGASWTGLGVPLDPTLLVTTVDVTATDAHRLYVSGTRGYGSSRTASLLVSSDDGATWTDHAAPFQASMESGLYIGAIDPTDATRVYLRTAGNQSRLLVTTDGGATFQVAALPLTGQMTGFALSSDGSTIYAGSVEDGLFVARRSDMNFQNVLHVHVRCLATHGAELWACLDEPGGVIAGLSTDDGATFAPRLYRNGFEGPIACNAVDHGPFACNVDANASQCGPPLDGLCQTLGVCSVSDGGSQDDGAVPRDPDAASNRGSLPAAPARGTTSGGCSLVSGGAGALSLLAVFAVAFFAMARRRRTPVS